MRLRPMHGFAAALLAAATVTVTACGGPPPGQAAPGTIVSHVAAGVRIPCETDFLAKLNPRQRLAQMLTVGVRGVSDAVNIERTEGVGGIFIGSWTDQSLLLNHQMDLVNAAAPAGVRPMVTIDEEGGRVSRVQNLIGAVPSARVMARTMTADQVYTLYLNRGRKLRELGVTVDFAPDADVSTEPDSAVIGDRSFSGDPSTVALYAGAAVRGLHDAGIGAVIKHFPGHGAGTGDSHKGAVTTPPLAQLQNRDLGPFRQLVSSGTAVMVGHLDVPGLTQPGFPASISQPAMTLLRQGTGYGAAPFAGIIFTDDLGGMAAITERMNIAEAVLTAVKAGADEALWITNAQVPQVLDRLQQAEAVGMLDPARVDDSVLRVARYKGALTCS